MWHFGCRRKPGAAGSWVVAFGFRGPRFVAASAKAVSLGSAVAYSSSQVASHQLFELDSLRPHERVIPPYLQLLTREIADDGVLKYAIVIDAGTRTILDGHHRCHALRGLGCALIPAVAVDYSDPGIRVGAWRRGEVVSKEDVLRAGLNGRLLPPKTSRHFFPFPPCRVNAPLRALRK